MSRSNPTQHLTNPSTRWLEWKGGDGFLQYWDKEKKERISVPDGFTFLVLDQLATVKGFHEPSESNIYANEVRDTKQEVLIVRMKSGLIAEGHWQAIKDKVNSKGASYCTSCYIAFKDESGQLVIGNIAMKGCALGPWIDFSSNNREAIWAQAVKIKAGVEEGKKIKFIPPIFSIVPISAETSDIAKGLDMKLQAYFKTYFARTKTEQSEAAPVDEPEPEEPRQQAPPQPNASQFDDTDEDQVPF